MYTGPYCYALMDAGEAFYVGKGRRGRMYQHVREAVRGKPGPKCDRIRAMLAAGREVDYQILSEHRTDAEAFEAEKAWVKQFAGLTNRTAGGGGVLAPDAAERDLTRAFLDAIKLRRRVLPFGQWLQKKRLQADEAGAQIYHQLVQEMDDLVALLGKQLRGEAGDGAWVL